jgi:hypothetical protein
MSLRTRYSKQEFQEIIDRVVRVDGNESELSSDSDFGDANDNSDDEEVAFAKTSDTSGKRTAQHETGQTVPPSSSFDWQHYEFNDCYFPDWLPAYRHRRGVLIDGSDYMPVDYGYGYSEVTSLVESNIPIQMRYGYRLVISN